MLSGQPDLPGEVFPSACFGQPLLCMEITIKKSSRKRPNRRKTPRPKQDHASPSNSTPPSMAIVSPGKKGKAPPAHKLIIADCVTPAPLPRPQQRAEIESVQLDLISCSEVRYEEVDGVHGVSYIHEDLDER